MIKIITVEREYGSGGAAIARKLAERLRWKLWDELLTKEIAQMMRCGKGEVEEREERRDPIGYRLLKSFMRGSFEGDPNAPQLQVLDADCIFRVTQRLVNEAADQGDCVIVGRGGAYFLADRPEAYHVFVYAPPEDKIRRLRELGKSEAEAKELVETVDVERAAFIKKYFNVEWPERFRYHQMINTSVGDDIVVDMILDDIAAFERRRSHAVR